MIGRGLVNARLIRVVRMRVVTAMREWALVRRFGSHGDGGRAPNTCRFVIESVVGSVIAKLFELVTQSEGWVGRDPCWIRE